MQEVRNSSGKLVCRIDPKTLTVEIVSKGKKTVIVFFPGDDPIVLSSDVV